jgi:hypothetical protein
MNDDENCKNFTTEIIDMLLEGAVAVEESAVEEDAFGTLAAIEDMIADLNVLRLSLALATSGASCSNCPETSCPSHPDFEGSGDADNLPNETYTIN